MEFPEYFIPSQEFILNLKIGDKVPNCFGKLAEVVEISHRGQDINGKWFVCFSTRFSPHSTITGSLKEGELNRTTALSRKHNSWELDEIEKGMNNE